MNRIISLLLASFAVGCGGSAIVGYVFQVDWLYSFGSRTAMAPSTAASVVALAGAVILHWFDWRCHRHYNKHNKQKEDTV